MAAVTVCFAFAVAACVDIGDNATEALVAAAVDVVSFALGGRRQLNVDKGNRFAIAVVLLP